MFTLKTLVLLFSITVYAYCQTGSSLNKKKESYNWRLSVSGGISHHYNKNLDQYGKGSATSLSYLEYGVGYFISPEHEIGIKIGRNDFVASPLALTGLNYTANDTIPIYETIYILESDVWYTLYYRFNYKTWYGLISIGTFKGFNFAYKSISLGKEFQLSNLFFINTGVNYAIRTGENIFDFKHIYEGQLTLSAGLSIKL